MPRTKQIKYNKFKTDLNCINYNYGEDNSLVLETLKNWTIGYTKIMLELCAGYCEYSLDFATQNPDTLCIAVDIKEDRLMFANIQASQKNLKNIRFIRTYIYNLDKLFNNNIDIIYLVHPDPQVHKKRIRLNQQKFQSIYYNILKPQGELRLITDNSDFYNEFIENIRNFKITKNILNAEKKCDLKILKTRYNQKFINENNPTKVLILNKLDKSQK